MQLQCKLVPVCFQGYLLEDFYIKKNGRLSGLDDKLQDGAVYRLEPRLCGGKGGWISSEQYAN